MLVGCRHSTYRLNHQIVLSLGLGTSSPFQWGEGDIDIPNHKLAYVIARKELVAGLWDSLKRYKIPFNTANHAILISLIQEKLENSSDVEREWTECEYLNFVTFSK